MKSGEPINILLVDDQPAKLLSYEVILKDLGETLLKAGSAREAFEHLLKHDIAVVLVDVCMPELDGFELAAMIRNHPRFQAMSIVFVSAVALTDLDLLKGYEYGAMDYVPVPVVPDLLRAKVRVFAELYRKTKLLETLNAELEHRVEARTMELAQANADLEHRVEQRTREREAAMAQLHEMQKLESLGHLTGGLAHDFNNVLMAILGNLDLIARNQRPDSTIRRFVHAAIQAAERGATLTKRMLAFARRQELSPEAVDAARLVHGMAEMLRRTLGPSIEIGMEFEDNIPHILVDPNQLELAILNLALNARDAMPEGGRLTIGARRATVEADNNPANLAARDYVSLTVTDTGTGMDEATLKRAAEPFFTTKELGKGTGLGLSMVYGLAAQSGGVTRMSSQLGVGTTIELWLPAADAAPAHQPRLAQPLAAAPARLRSILLVDDDPMVAEGTAAMLDHLGHSVIVASSGLSALEVIRSDAKIDLVITDHAMPGMTGMELAREIRRMRPSLPVVLATGYAELPNGKGEEMFRIDKPYRMDKLESLVAAFV